MSGMGVVVQAVEPVAEPLAPADVDHTTDVTPTLSLAFPRTTIESELLVDVAVAGEVMVMDGAVVSAVGTE